jgi:hypothetical protein
MSSACPETEFHDASSETDVTAEIVEEPDVTQEMSVGTAALSQSSSIRIVNLWQPESTLAAVITITSRYFSSSLEVPLAMLPYPRSPSRGYGQSQLGKLLSQPSTACPSYVAN